MIGRSRTNRLSMEKLDDRRMMAVVTAESTFDPIQFGENIETILEASPFTQPVGYGYSIEQDGNHVTSGAEGHSQAPHDGDREFTANSRMEIASISKTITALATLKLLNANGIDPSESIGPYLPSHWSADSDFEGITFHQLLTHRSGITQYARRYSDLKQIASDGPDGTVGASSYSTTNQSLLRVILPYVEDAESVQDSIDALVDVGLFNTDVATDWVTANGYKNYVRDELLAPMGIEDADTTHSNLAYPTKVYLISDTWSPTEPGGITPDRHFEVGGMGWNLSANDLGKFMIGMRYDHPTEYEQMKANRYGFFNTLSNRMHSDEDGDNTYYAKTGGNEQKDGVKRVNTVVMDFPNAVQAALVMNSNGFEDTKAQVLADAYDNAWSDIVYEGTEGNDTFVINIADVGGIETLQLFDGSGNVLFSQWVATLDSLTINGLGGNDTLIVEERDSVNLVFNGGTGSDALITGQSTGNLETVNGLTFHGGSGTDTVSLNDSNNPYSHGLSRQYTVSSTGVHRFAAHPIVAGAPIGVGVDFSGVEDLTLTTGDQTDIVTVGNAGIVMTLNTGAGNDTVLIVGTRNMEAVNGLTINGGGGTDTVSIDDSNNPYSHGLSRMYTVSSTGVSRFASHPVVQGAPIGIGVDLSSIEDLTLTTGDQTDIVTVGNAGIVMTLNTGGGSDTVLIVGTRNMEAVNGLTVNGGNGTDTVSIDDSNNPYSHGLSRLYSASSSGVSRFAAHPVLQGAPIGVGVDLSSVEDLTLTTGDQADIVTVDSAGMVMTLNTGGGNDTVLTGGGTGNLEAVNGLTVNGGSGTDTVSIDDSNNPYSHGLSRLYTVTPGRVSRFAAHPVLQGAPIGVGVDLSSVEDLTLSAGSDNDVIQIAGNAQGGALTVYGNNGIDQFHVYGAAFSSMDLYGGDPQANPDTDFFAGGRQALAGDVLVLHGNGTAVGSVTPDPLVQGAGVATIDGALVQYAEMEQVEIDDFAAVVEPISYQSGVVSVHGTGLNDAVTVHYVSRPGGRVTSLPSAWIRVQLTHSFGTIVKYFKGATSLDVHLYGGHDNFSNHTAIPSTVDGGAGDDTLLGGSATDNFRGGAGDDHLSGRGGNDVLDGEFGDDLLIGGAGFDFLVGDEGADRLYGDGHDDSLFGGPGPDLLHGGSGNDILDGGDDSDVLMGEGGRDLIIGGNGRDELNGGGDQDLIVGAKLEFSAYHDALHHLWSEWTSGHSLSARRRNVLGQPHSQFKERLNENDFLTGKTVIDDKAVDEFIAQLGDGDDLLIVGDFDDYLPLGPGDVAEQL